MKVTAKHRYATIGFIYLFGLICASFLDAWACVAVFAVLALIFGISLSSADNFLKISSAFLAAAFLIFGLYRFVFIQPLTALEGQKATVDAVVTDCRAPDNDTVLLTLSGETDGRPLKLSLFAEDSGINVGDRIHFEAVFSKLSDSAEFSESSYNFSKGIFLRAYAVSDIAVTEGSGGIAEYTGYISDYFKSIVDTQFSDERGGLLKAMFFGDKSGISHRTSVDMKRSGISHLTAVSGTHLSLMIHLFAGMLSFFFRRKGRLYFLIISVYIFFLMLFFGMTASVMRSGFMMLVFYGSELFRRKSDTLASVGAALMIILAVNPLACRDIGLLLSVTGTLGVGIVSPAVSDAFNINRKRVFTRLIVASFCASACTMPVGALCFDGISLAAPLTTVLVQPFFTVMITLVPFALIIPFLSGPILFVSGVCADITAAISSFIGGFDFSYIPLDGKTVVLFILLTVSGAVISGYISGKAKPVIVFCAFSAFSFVASQSLYGIISYDDITINITADSKETMLCVSDKTGRSFYMLSSDSSSADRIYEYSAGQTANFVCICSQAGNLGELSSLCNNIHTPENGCMLYDVSGEYSVKTTEDEILLDIRGVTVGLLPAGSETQCDIAVYCGYKEKYGSGGNSATILCDKKYYNCGEAVNAFLDKTEIIINTEGMYALSVK
ncbi:MAG: ComEC/Rec2 family competence protein [Ruminiclostridium sp.]|nr:ComEC/Rec2 family competence protein [Ruminiclostridium sp.]